MSTSKLYHHGDLRAALLETTRSLLAEVGLEGLSLREVSRQAGVSHAAAYNHFRDKAALVRAVVDAAFDRLAAEMRRARSTTSDTFERFERIGLAYVRFAYRNPAEFKIMFRPELSDAPKAGTESYAAYELLVTTVVECQAAGTVNAGPTDAIVLAAWSMVHGISSLIVDGPDPDLAPTLAAAETLARSCIAQLADGMRVQPPAKAAGKRRTRRP